MSQEQTSNTSTDHTSVGQPLPNDTVSSDNSEYQSVIQLPTSQLKYASPDDIPIESFQENAAILHKVPKSQHVDIYDRAAEFMDLPEEHYTEDNLILGTQLTKQFIIAGTVVANSATGLATQCKIDKGRLMSKVLDIHDAVIGTGREKYAKETFPYPKETRCMYIRISKIAGVDSYTSLGTDRLRKVATAIEKTGVEGPDQIKALFEKYNEECNLSIGHKEFIAKLQSILDRVLKDDTEDTGGCETVTGVSTEEGDSAGTETNTEPDNCKDGSDNSEINTKVESSEDTETTTAVEGSGDIEPVNEVINDEEDSGSTTVATESTTVKGGSSESIPDAEDTIIVTASNEDSDSTENGDSSTPVNNDEEENGKKRFLNQESINVTLAKFIGTVDELLSQEPPTYALDLEMFRQARTCLDKLEDYVQSTSEL